MKKLIDESADWFEYKKRGDETITVLKDDAPEALRDSVRAAHGDRLPDDWIYATYHSILDALGQYTIENTEDLEEQRAEIVDGLVDVYTSDLTGWLNADNRNVYYMTEAQEEYGAQQDGFKLLAMAQYKAIDEIYGEVASYLAAASEEDEE